MRIVIDVNDFISALIGKGHRRKLEVVLANPTVEIVADEHLLTELIDVAQRDKFRKYVSVDEIGLFLDVLRFRLTIISATSIIRDCSDPDDNYLLALAVDAQADYLITGDKADLLSLSPYRGIPIIRLQTFLDILAR